MFTPEETLLSYLEIHAVKFGKLVTVIELLSPTNKIPQRGRDDYLEKREEILRTRTNLVVIGLLRAGIPMPIWTPVEPSHYRIIVRRGSRRPRAELYAFSVQDPIPPFSLPLLKGDDEPMLDIGAIFHALYNRARYDLRLDYSQPPVPPLSEENAAWAQTLIA